MIDALLFLGSFFLMLLGSFVLACCWALTIAHFEDRKTEDPTQKPGESS